MYDGDPALEPAVNGRHKILKKSWENSMQLRESPLESSPGGGGTSEILSASWASEIVTNGRDQCTIVQLHVRPKECHYHDVTSGLLPGLC